MKLFDSFEAVRFSEENLIFITKNGYIYYIFDPKYKFWKKYENAGNVCITIENYADVSEAELALAMGGTLPQSETDFMRLCRTEQLQLGDMLDLLRKDYPAYMSDCDIASVVRRFIKESDIQSKSYQRLRELFDKAVERHENKAMLLAEIRELSFDIIGRNIFREEIGIVDGHDSSSYFWIMPTRVIDLEDDSVAELSSAEISIEEDDVAQYLTPFLYKYFDGELEANKYRIDGLINHNGKERYTYVEGFEWNLTYNFYSFDAVRNILGDMRDTIDVLSAGGENEYTGKILSKRSAGFYVPSYVKAMGEEQQSEAELITDFYKRFIYRMEYMMTVGEEKGYSLISIMGP